MKIFDRANRRLVLAFAAFAALVVGMCYFSFLWLESQSHHTARLELRALAERKQETILRWRQERASNARWIFEASAVPQRARAWFRQEENGRLRDDLLRWMEAWREDWTYSRVLLVDATRVVRLTSPADSGAIDQSARAAIESAMNTGKVVMVDIHTDSVSQQLAMGFAVPLLDRTAEPWTVVGGLYLEIDPTRYLFPQLRRPANAGPTVEVLLMRAEAGSPLVLNAPTCADRIALLPRRPLVPGSNPAAPFFPADGGLFEAIDYRGQPVLAASARIPDSSWLLVAKQNLAEINAPNHERAWTLASLAVSLIAGAALTIGWVRRGREARFMRQQLAQREAAEASLRESARRLDEAQRIARLGFFRLELATYQWTSTDALDDIYGISADFPHDAKGWSQLVHPDDREATSEHFQHDVIESRAVFRREYRIIRPSDGSVRWMQPLGKLVLGTSGEPEFLVGTVQDITERKAAELALEQSRQRLAAHVRQTPLGVIEWDVDFRVTAWNPAAEQIFGFTAAEAIGRTAAELVVLPGQRPLVQAFWRHLLAGKAGQRRTTSNVTKGGRIIQCDWYNTRLIDPEGTVTAVASLVLDMTDHLKAQEALARSRAELEAIYEHAPTIMLLMDTTGRIRRMNRAALEFVQLDAGNVVGKCCGDALGCSRSLDAPGGCGLGPECRECQLRHTMAATARDGNPNARVETRLRLVRRGASMEFVLLASSATLKVQNETMHLLCLEDVTREREAEEQIREQAALLNVTQDAVFVLDLEGAVTFWNRGAESLYGWTSAEAIGRLLADIIGSDLNGTTFEQVKEALWSTGEWRGELNRVNRSRKRRIVQSRAALVRDAAGDPRSILVVNTDVTESKQLEAQFLRAQRLDSLGKLASGVAHDLNNVLSPILLSVELLRPLARTKADENLVELLTQSVKRGAGVVRQLLLFGRGTEEPRGPVDVGQAVAELIRIARETFPKNIAVTSDVPSGLSTVVADPTQLYQVLLNLAVNARDAMPEGGIMEITVREALIDAPTVRAHPEAKPGRYVVVQVSDTGSGIAPEIIDKIFDPFFTTKPVGSGTGLGLSTVMGIVRHHGGFITVESQPREGTRMSVHLPAAGPGPQNEAEPAAPVTSGSGETVLVVEDEAAGRETLQRVLENAGYHALVAKHGAQALTVYADRRPEVKLAIVDMVMPVMGGIETIRALRQSEPRLPIIAISGLAGWEDKVRAAGNRNVDFLKKPFTAAELVAAVRRLLPAGVADSAADSLPAQPH